MATKASPSPIPGIEKKSELKLLGKTFNEDPCKWDTHLDFILKKSGSRMYILHV